MSAISGMVGLPSDPAVCETLSRTMVRRGPGGQKLYRRKGCTLLNAFSQCNPPEAWEASLDWKEDRYTITWDGALFNGEELRRELRSLGHCFRGSSDEELVLHSYVQWKEACLEKFNGVFAFGIWADGNQELFLARDRIGVKPLFYALKNQGILFASELKTILAHPDVPAELDGSGAAEIILLGPGRTPGSAVLKGISELKGGCWGCFSRGKWREHGYWALRDREHTETFDQTAEHVRQLLTDAVRRQIQEKTPGILLSGGLDSSLLTAICAKEQKAQLETFSVDYVDQAQYFHPTEFQPNADNGYIQLMADAAGTRHRRIVLSARDLEQGLEDAVRARDLPGMADVDSSLLKFCGEIRKYTDTALSGECADELFGGYPWYMKPEMRDYDGFPWVQNTRNRIALLHPQIREKIDGEDFVRCRYEETLKKSDILPGCQPLERRMKELFNLNFYWFMQTLLDRNDRMSMYQGLSVRVPFCDYRLAEYLYGVPWEMKAYKGREKGLLRKAMEGLVPMEILWRRKSPYPKTFDPGYSRLIQSRLTDLLEDGEAPLFSLVSRETVRDFARRNQPQPWYGQLMNTPQIGAFLLQTDFWLREYHIRIIS